MANLKRWRYHLLVSCLVLGVALLGAMALEHNVQADTERQSAVREPTILRVGLIPEQDIFAQKKRYAPLMEYLSAELGIRFEIHLLSRYGNLIENFNELELDAAFFGSFTGAMAIEKLGVVPLARPQYIGGRSSYYGMVFVRKDSGIRSAADMRDKRMVFVDRATTAGYLLPLAYFQEQGINDYKSWFKKYYFSGTHEDAILEVLNGFADIGAAKNTIFYQLANSDPRVTQDLQILTTSPPVPANALAVRPGLSEGLITLIREKLLTMHKTPQGLKALEQFGAEQFLLTTVDDYQPVIDYAHQAGIDLSSYRYFND